MIVKLDMMDIYAKVVLKRIIISIINMDKTARHVQKNQKRLSNLYLDFLQFHWFTCSFISKTN